MLPRTAWLLIGILLCATAFSSAARAQSQSTNQTQSQSQTSSHSQAPPKTDPQAPAQSQEQDLLEASRKAKAKKQQQQKTDETTSSESERPKVYTSDDFTASGGDGPNSRSAVGHGEKPEKGKDTAEVTISLPQSSIKRGTGTQVNWSVLNTSDHWEQIIAILTVTGPCNHQTVHRIRYNVNPGGSRTDDAFNTMFYEEQCPGDYTFELRAESNRQVLSSATTTLTVK